MTTPNQPAPAGAYQVGGGDFRFGQDYTDDIVTQIVMGPVPSMLNALDIMAEQLLKLPLSALQRFQGFITGATDADFLDVPTAVQTIIDSLSLKEILLKVSEFEDWVGGVFDEVAAVVQQILEILGGLIVTPINDAVQDVKDWWNSITAKTEHLTSGGLFDATKLFGLEIDLVDGLEDEIADIADAAADAWDRAGDALAGLFDKTDSTDFSDLLNKIFDGSNGTTGSTGKTISNVLAALQGHRTATSTAQSTATTAAGNASTALSNATTALADAASALSGLSGKAPLTAFNDFIDAVKQGADGSATTSNTAAQAKDALLSLLGLGNAANAAALAAQATLAQQETSTPTGGNSSTYTPSGSDGAALSGWTSSGSNEVCTRVTSGRIAIGLASGVSDGTNYYAVYTAKMFATVDQSASAVLSESVYDNSLRTTICIRSTSALANGAYCHAETDGIKIGYYTKSSGVFTFNQLASQAMTIDPGSRVTFRCFGLNYYVLVNGVQVLSFTNTGNNVTQSVSTNASTGLVMSRTSPFGIVLDSFRVSSFSMSDYYQGTTTVTSFLLTRSSTSTSALAVANGDAAAIPASFFSTQVSAVNVTVTTLGTGEITIITDGVYRLTAAVMATMAVAASSATKAAYASHWCVMLGNSQITGPIPAGTSIDIPLVAGNVIKPAVVAVAPLPAAPRTTSQSFASNQTVGNNVAIVDVRGFSSWSGVLVD